MGRACMCLLLLGCGPSAELPPPAENETGTSTAMTPPPGTTTAWDDSSSGGESSSSSSSSSGEPVLDGPGCEPPPACDRGEYVGSIDIRSAGQIDEIAGYTSITGWLSVTDSDLECLSFLACLESAGHDVHVHGNAALRTLDGTDALTEVGVRTEDEPGSDRDGSIVISSNAALDDVDGFNGLEELPQSLAIVENEGLTAVSGFGALRQISVDLVVARNPALEDVEGLKDLRRLANECQINNNPNLCISDVFEVCGDLQVGGEHGNTENNKAGC